MSHVSKVLTLYKEVGEKEGYLRQIVSYNNVFYTEDPSHAMTEIMNAWFLQADKDIIDEDSPGNRLPSISDDSWDEMEPIFKEDFQGELYLWGNDTRVAQRIWYYKGDEVMAVTVKKD